MLVKRLHRINRFVSLKVALPMYVFGRQVSGAARAVATPLLRKQTEDGLGAALFSFGS